ncbi:MAG TPA: outer membrane beta-barrel protein [Candidatus Angelobacter sp.]|jgi:opacity protein-like surface antigen|nr:outer membrane beta-barrel protein [Candidatus Angelobacter sp.]
MRKILVLFTFLFFAISGWSQTTRNMSHEGSSGDVFIGYSLLNGDTLSHGSGWEAALTGNLRDWFGLKADLGGNYKSVGGLSAREYNIIFGPQISHRVNKFNIFVHGLLGVAHFSTDGGPSDTGAAWTLGGGVDYDLNSNFAFRPIQLDYHGAHVFSTTQKDARYSVGLVYRFK